MKTTVCFILLCILVSVTSCNSFFKFSQSSSPVEKVEATWLAKILQDGNHHDLEAFTLNFSPLGKVVAKCSGCKVNGFWYEDEISNKFIMSFEPNQSLCELNKSWAVQISGSSKVILKSTDKTDPLTLTLLIP